MVDGGKDCSTDLAASSKPRHETAKKPNLASADAYR
jgi:hypothetical protein